MASTLTTPALTDLCFVGVCIRALGNLIRMAAQGDEAIIQAIMQAQQSNTPWLELLRLIAIARPAPIFWHRLHSSLISYLPSFIQAASAGLSISAIVILLATYYLHRDLIILERRSTENDTQHEYLFQSRIPFLPHTWRARSSLTGAERERALEFDVVIQTPQAVIDKRAVDRNGNPCSSIEGAAGMEYLVRAEGWRVGRIADVWVGRQRLVTNYALWPMVCRYEAERRSRVGVVPLVHQRPAQPRDRLGRFVRMN